MKQAFTAAAGALIAACTLLWSCSGSGSDVASSTFEEMPVVAAKSVTAAGDTIVTANLAASGDVVTIPASEIIDDLKIVRLEDNDEALIGEAMTWISNGRILTYNHSDGVVHTFDFDGKYLGKIGGRGNGPGEYAIAPYDVFYDSKAGKYYMVAYSAKKIMTYNSDGTFDRDIPIAFYAPKSVLGVDTEKGRITVAALQFTDAPDAPQVWVQDFEGNVISRVDMPWLDVVPDFSNEIYSNVGSDPSRFTYSMWRIGGSADSVYTYSGGRLTPRFTADLEKGTIHQYFDKPSFYAAVIHGDPKPVGENSYIIPGGVPFIVDKATLRGGFAHLRLDELGGLVFKKAWTSSSSPDYFVLNTGQGNLIDAIEKALEGDVDAESARKMRELRFTLDEDGNNIVIFGRWK